MGLVLSVAPLRELKLELPDTWSWRPTEAALNLVMHIQNKAADGILEVLQNMSAAAVSCHE